MYIDSHAHLDGPRFDPDRAEVISRARAAGVSTILAIGIGEGPGTLDCAVKLAAQYDFIYATTGIHPHEAAKATDADFAQLEELARAPKVIACGEIGLDYYYDHSPRDIQKNVFIRQMEIARAAKLPIIIHCRASEKNDKSEDKIGDNNKDNAWDDCLSLIDQHWKATGLGGILHCFTSTWPHAKRALDMGFLISFAGNLTFPKAQQIRDSAKEVPLDRILIETDCPFLAPVPYRGKRNEPAYVIEVARQLAEIKSSTREEIGSQTSANFRRLFSLPESTQSI
jgi:TatD DNase family protein